MNIKRTILTICSIGLFSLSSSGQEASHTPPTKHLTQSIPMFSAGYMTLRDTYLSPLTYSGYNLAYKNEWWMPLADHLEPYTQTVKLGISAGQLINSAYTNSILHAHLDISWGTHYHHTLAPGLTLIAGGQCEMSIGGKLIGRNVNNPGSADFATTIDLSAGLQYAFHCKTHQFRLRYMLQTPIVGCMFVPEWGASYYEMFDLMHLKNAFHFSSFHNMQQINHALTIDMRFGRSTWRIGVEHTCAHWATNNLHFNHNKISGLIGTVLDIGYWGGNQHTNTATIQQIW